MDPTEKARKQLNKCEKAVTENLGKISRLSEKNIEEAGKYDHQIQELREKIDQEFAKTEKMIAQAQAYEEMKYNRQKEADRKSRTRRLIQTGAVLESATGFTFPEEEDRQLLLQYLQETDFRSSFLRWLNHE